MAMPACDSSTHPVWAGRSVELCAGLFRQRRRSANHPCCTVQMNALSFDKAGGLPRSGRMQCSRAGPDFAPLPITILKVSRRLLAEDGARLRRGHPRANL